MTEIELSIMAETSDAAEPIRHLLDEFEDAHRIRVRLTILPYEQAWMQIVNYALDNNEPMSPRSGRRGSATWWA